MGRAKKEVEKYTLDFKLPHRTRELLYNEDGSERYTTAELLEIAAKNPSNYAQNFVPSAKEYFSKNGAITSQQDHTLHNLAADYCPASDSLNVEFLAWYATHPDIQEVYKNAAPDHYWWPHTKGDGYISSEDAQANGWHDAPPNWQTFQRIWYGHAASKYREINREIKYDIGDMVQIRNPHVGSWRHDPCYNTDKGIARIGTVVEHNNELDRRSRAGKGSRLINVLWLNTGETKAVAERLIKKLPKQK
ncbi:MAG: hypothetical protein FJ351_06665 [Sphingomonadales bacterium]|nr:hypothetical protein [Sphingomonadales bacterium]